MPFRWPTDPAGKAPSHTISWDQHQTNLKAKQAPGAPALPTPGNPLPLELPPDPLWSAEAGPGGSLERTRDVTLAGLTQQRTAGLTEYGYNEDPTTGALSFDPNNPFSKAALLKKNYDTQRARTGQSMAAGGQLYQGSYQNSQDLLNRGQVQDQDALDKALAAFLFKNRGDADAARTAYETGMQRADADRIFRLPDNPLYSPTATAADAAAVTPPKPGAPPKGLGGQVPLGGGKQPSTIKAGPSVKATKNTTVKRTKKGKTVTYSTSIKGP